MLFLAFDITCQLFSSIGKCCATTRNNQIYHKEELVSLRELIFLFTINSSELLKDLIGALFINIIVAVRQCVNFI